MLKRWATPSAWEAGLTLPCVFPTPTQLIDIGSPRIVDWLVVIKGQINFSIRNYVPRRTIKMSCGQVTTVFLLALRNPHFYMCGYISGSLSQKHLVIA